jgi:L-methionine (R)-S-oxide reductase
MSGELSYGEYPEEKEELYALLKQQLNVLVSDERHPIPNLANASALLWMALRDINWAGFYLMIDGELLLGPFQGKPACIRIKVGNGVCGTAVLQDKVQLVKDVHEFPGHIACDSASNSEIVVPIHHGGHVVGVLDVDSPSFARFDEADQRGLEALVSILERACHFS